MSQAAIKRMALILPLLRRKNAGLVPIAARRFHGKRQHAMSAAANTQLKRMRFPAGESFCAVSCFLWFTGTEMKIVNIEQLIDDSG